MTSSLLFAAVAAGLVGIGLYGSLTHADPVRRLLAFNLLGSGVFLVFGVIAWRGAEAGLAGDPVPQAIVITGIVVAFAATTLAVALVLRLRSAIAGRGADATTEGGQAP